MLCLPILVSTKVFDFIGNRFHLLKTEEIIVFLWVQSLDFGIDFVDCSKEMTATRRAAKH